MWLNYVKTFWVQNKPIFCSTQNKSKKIYIFQRLSQQNTDNAGKKSTGGM